MIKTIERTELRIAEEFEYIECDCCHKKFYKEDICERQEFLYIHQVGGYGSIFGDEAKIECDLCQHCIKELLGPYLRVGPNWIEQEFRQEEEKAGERGTNEKDGLY